MKAALRWVVIGMVGVTAAPFGAYAVGPMSNGVGDGEANVPFASQGMGADEGAGRARADRAPYGADRRKVAGRSGRATDRPAPADGTGSAASQGDDAAPQTGGDGTFEQMIWTAP